MGTDIGKNGSLAGEGKYSFDFSPSGRRNCCRVAPQESTSNCFERVGRSWLWEGQTTTKALYPSEENVSNFWSAIVAAKPSLVRGGTLLLWLNYQWSDRIWVSDLNSLFIYLSVFKMREVLLRIQSCPCSAQPGLNSTHPSHSLHHNNKSMEFLFFNVASSHSWRCWGPLCRVCSHLTGIFLADHMDLCSVLHKRTNFQIPNSLLG